MQKYAKYSGRVKTHLLSTTFWGKKINLEFYLKI